MQEHVRELSWVRPWRMAGLRWGGTSREGGQVSVSRSEAQVRIEVAAARSQLGIHKLEVRGPWYGGTSFLLGSSCHLITQGLPW